MLAENDDANWTTYCQSLTKQAGLALGGHCLMKIRFLRAQSSVEIPTIQRTNEVSVCARLLLWIFNFQGAQHNRMRTTEFRLRFGIFSLGEGFQLGSALVDEPPHYKLLLAAYHVARLSLSSSLLGRHLVYEASDAHTAELNRRWALINTEKATIMPERGTSRAQACVFAVECTADGFTLFFHTQI